jgi:hypothetical protein
MLNGSGSVDHPLQICLNNNLLLHHLRLINIRGIAETKNIYNIFIKLLDLLNAHLMQVHCNDGDVPFMNGVLAFIKRLGQMNEQFFSMMLVKASLVYIESARFKYQK